MTNTRLIQPGGGFLKRYLHPEWFSVTGLKRKQRDILFIGCRARWINKCTSVTGGVGQGEGNKRAEREA